LHHFERLQVLSEGGEKAQSLVALKAAAAERRRLGARAEHEAAQLPGFIRLVDQLAVEALVQLAVQVRFVSVNFKSLHVPVLVESNSGNVYFNFR
jgi:hypothetical protein